MSGDRTWFRYALGFGVILGGFALVGALIAFSVPSTNRDAVMLAIGVVLGWGSSVVAFEFGSSPAERKAADSSADAPTGKPGDPVSVTETTTEGEVP